MGKFTSLFTNVYSVFGTSEWTANNIKTIPANFTGTVNNSKYIRVSVIPSDKGVNIKSVSGIVIIDIFVETGEGPSSITFIADKLDEFLVGRTIQVFTGSTQFLSSSLSLLGIDSFNTSLYRAKYEIPFNHFGV
jgi:hypothetical protein